MAFNPTSECAVALLWLREIIERLGLKLNEAKTQIRDARRESFDFLGYTFGPLVSQRTGRTYLGAAPSKRAVRRMRRSLWRLLRSGNQAPRAVIVVEMNRRLEGWANYFSIGTVQRSYWVIDHGAADLLRRFLVRRHKVSGRGTRRFSNQYLHEQLGLVQLLGRRAVLTSHAVT